MKKYFSYHIFIKSDLTYLTFYSPIPKPTDITYFFKYRPMKYLPLFLLLCLSFVACDMFRPVGQNNTEDPPVVETPATDDDPIIEPPRVDPPATDFPPGNAIVREWIHRPLHPDNFQSVQFKINAVEPAGANRVVLSIYEYEWYRNDEGLPSKRKRTNGKWGQAKEWTFTEPLKNLNLAYTYSKGFPAGTNVEYIFQIYSVDGKRTEKLALFDAGDSRWPDDKIMLYATSRHALGQSINLCFVPDTDYNTNGDARNWSMFLGDVEDLIYNGYHKNNMVRNHKENWAFFYTREAVDGFQLALDFGNPDRFPSFMRENIIDGIDAFGLLHRNEYSDGAYLLGNLQFLAQNLFTSESYNHGTAIHETGHAVFNLSDEYNGCVCFESDTGLGQNVFSSRSACQSFNRTNGFSDVDCTEITGYNGMTWYMSERNVYFPTLQICQDFNQAQGHEPGSCITFQDLDGRISYRSNAGLCIMQDDGDDIVRDFQQTCGSLIDRYYERMELSALAMTPQPIQDNTYGYEKIALLELENNNGNWEMEFEKVRYGIPAKDRVSPDAYTLSVVGPDDQMMYATSLDRPNLVKFEGGDRDHHKTVETPKAAMKVAIPYSKKIKDLQLYDNQPPRALPGNMVIRGTERGSGMIKNFPMVVKKMTE